MHISRWPKMVTNLPSWLLSGLKKLQNWVLCFISNKFTRPGTSFHIFLGGAGAITTIPIQFHNTKRKWYNLLRFWWTNFLMCFRAKKFDWKNWDKNISDFSSYIFLAKAFLPPLLWVVGIAIRQELLNFFQTHAYSLKCES